MDSINSCFHEQRWPPGRQESERAARPSTNLFQCFYEFLTRPNSMSGRREPKTSLAEDSVVRVKQCSGFAKSVCVVSSSQQPATCGEQGGITVLQEHLWALIWIIRVAEKVGTSMEGKVTGLCVASVERHTVKCVCCCYDRTTCSEPHTMALLPALWRIERGIAGSCHRRGVWMRLRCQDD